MRTTQAQQVTQGDVDTVLEGLPANLDTSTQTIGHGC